jgi:hypothetical protein
VKHGLLSQIASAKEVTVKTLLHKSLVVVETSLSSDPTTESSEELTLLMTTQPVKVGRPLLASMSTTCGCKSLLVRTDKSGCYTLLTEMSIDTPVTLTNLSSQEHSSKSTVVNGCSLV